MLRLFFDKMANVSFLTEIRTPVYAKFQYNISICFVRSLISTYCLIQVWTGKKADRGTLVLTLKEVSNILLNSFPNWLRSHKKYKVQPNLMFHVWKSGLLFHCELQNP